MHFILQDTHLDKLREDGTEVTVMLNNGVKVIGRVESHDQFMVTITDRVPQGVFKHAIAFIQTPRPNLKRRPAPEPFNPIPISPRLPARERSYESREPRDYTTPRSSTGAKSPVIIRKKTRTVIAPGGDGGE